MKARNQSFVPSPTYEAVPLDRIQGAVVHEDQSFDELVSSVTLMGILQPVVLLEPKSHNGKYKIIAGRRRCFACVKLGISHISAMVFPKSTDEAFIDISAITENSVRSNNIGTDVMAMKRLVDDGERDVSKLSTETGLPKSRIKQLFELIDLPEPIVRGIVEGVVAPTTAKEVKKLQPKTMERALAVLEETGRLTGKDIHKVREVQVSEAADQIVLPSIPELLVPGEMTVMYGNPEHGKTQISVSNYDMFEELKGQIVQILNTDIDEHEKLVRIAARIGYDPWTSIEAEKGATIAQRVRKAKNS